MLVLPEFPSTPSSESRAAVLAELRLLLSRPPGWLQPLDAKLSFGLVALDCHLPNGGLTCGALHEVVPATQAALPAVFGFIVAVLARLSSNFSEAARNKQIIFVMPDHGSRQCGRFSGHGLNGHGFDPTRVILVETRHRRQFMGLAGSVAFGGAASR